MEGKAVNLLSCFFFKNWVSWQHTTECTRKDCSSQLLNWGAIQLLVLFDVWGYWWKKERFLCLKYFGLAEALFLRLRGKLLMMTSSEHEPQTWSSTWLFSVSAGDKEQVLGLVFECWIILYSWGKMASDCSLKNWRREKFPCRIILFLPFFSTSFPTDRSRF